MPSRRPTRQQTALEQFSRGFESEHLLSFLELRPFTRQWDSLGLTEKTLLALQVAIMADPRASPVIEGSGGVRKMRFGPPGFAKGKSGSLRVCYAYIEEVGIVILAFVYEKGEKDTLNTRELTTLRAAVDRVRELILRNPYRCKGKHVRASKPEGI